MAAHDILGGIASTVRRVYATVLRGEVSDVNLRGYLRAASQIEDVSQELDLRLAALRGEGIPPWEAYARLRYAFLFLQVARLNQLFVRRVLSADETWQPATRGYLPRLTYDQADALSRLIQPNVERALAALRTTTYHPDVDLPLTFGPRVDSGGQRYPLAYLLGLIGAAREAHNWADGLLSQYAQQVNHADVPVPREVHDALAAYEARLAGGESRLRFATDLIGRVSQGEATDELSSQAADLLWMALRTFSLVCQAIAMPELLRRQEAGVPALRTTPRLAASPYEDMPVQPDDLWEVAAPSARAELRGTEFGTEQMRQLWDQIDGILLAGVQQYLDDTGAAVARGDIVAIAAMATPPFESLYRAERPVDIAGVHIPAGHEFHWNYTRGHIESAPRFARADQWQTGAH